MNGIGLDLGDWVEEVEGMTCTCELSRAGAAASQGRCWVPLILA